MSDSPPTPESPFTDEQVAELETRAEARDQRRPRQSKFSTGEQGELDETANLLRAEQAETARTLDFNELQSADLTHRFNVAEQQGLSASAKRFWLLLVAAIVILALAFVFISLQAQTQANHAALVTLCHAQTKVDCQTLFK